MSTTPSVILPPVPAAVFSTSQWSTLAQLLAKQDLIVLPGGDTPQLAHEDADTAAETAHRRASGLALVQHWASMGFVLSKADALRVCATATTTHAWLHKTITPALKERLGGHVRMTPMYPDFPKQVMKMDEAALLFNALVHYMGDMFDLRIVPELTATARKKLPKSEGTTRALRLLDQSGVHDSLTQLVAMNTVWTPAQVELATTALPLLLHWGIVGPNTSAPQRENQARLTGAWLHALRANPTMSTAWPADRVSTTDILRAAVAHAGGDPSLASTSPKVRFAKLSRPQRRVLMTALEQAVTTTKAPLDDLHAQRQAWLRLAEQLHAGEWSKMPNAQKAIASLRNDRAPQSWRAKLDGVLSQSANPQALAQLTALIGDNPGYTARAMRRIVAWATTPTDRAAIVTAFTANAHRLDTPLLLSVDASFAADAQAPNRARVMLPKGSAAWRYRVDKSAAASIPSQTGQDIRDACQATLLDRFSALPALGNVYVQDGLDDVLVPRGLRSASDSVGVVARGSKLPIDPDAKIIRLFLWWTDTDTGRVDVDLSAVGVNGAFRTTETCNFHSMREAGMTHSGDLTSAPEGAAEFVDIRMDKLNPDTRYIVLSANVFSGPAFSKLPECFVGWQTRTHGQRGEIMELRTVAEKFQVTCSSKGFLGAVFDVKTRTLMWLDLPINTRTGHSVHDQRGNIEAAVQDFQLYAASQPKMGDLIRLHIQARNGTIVTDPKKADVVFALTSTVAHKDQAVIAATQPLTVASALMAGAPRTADTTQPAQALGQEEQIITTNINVDLTQGAVEAANPTEAAPMKTKTQRHPR